MAWPPPLLPTDRTNATPQQDVHPADHNALNLAINDIAYRMQIQPSWASFLSSGFLLTSAFPNRIGWVGVRSDGSIGTNVDSDIFFPSAGIYAIHVSMVALITESHASQYPYLNMSVNSYAPGGGTYLTSESAVSGGQFWMQVKLSTIIPIQAGGKIQTFLSGEWLSVGQASTGHCHCNIHRLSPPIVP